MINPPPLQIPIATPVGGLTTAWLAWFDQLRNSVSGTEDSDYLKSPDAASNIASISALLAASLQEFQVTSRSQTLPQLDEVLKRIEALECLPVPEPRNAPRYGSFSDTTDQTQTATNTAQAMTFNTTDLSFGVYIGSPSSRIYVDRISVYNIQFSAQILNASGGAHDIWIWLRKNGTDVADSATQIRVEGNNTEAVAAWNFLLKMNADDYFELMWEVTDTAVSLWHDTGTAVHPAIPSVLLSVTDNISNY